MPYALNLLMKVACGSQFKRPWGHTLPPSMAGSQPAPSMHFKEPAFALTIRLCLPWCRGGLSCCSLHVLGVKAFVLDQQLAVWDLDQLRCYRPVNTFQPRSASCKHRAQSATTGSPTFARQLKPRQTYSGHTAYQCLPKATFL